MTMSTSGHNIPQFPTPAQVGSAEDTHSLFNILHTWCQSATDSETSADISEPVQNLVDDYLRILELSVSVSRNGFKISETVITRSKAFETYNSKDRERYLREALEQSQVALKSADDVFLKVFDLWQGIEQHLKDVRQRLETSVDQEMSRELEKAEAALKNFFKCVATYYRFWCKRYVNHNFLVDCYTALIHGDPDQCHKSILMTWDEHRKQYIAYLITMESIQASHNPNFWKDPKK